MRWLDDVSMDLRKMGIYEWRDRARERELEAYCSGGQGLPRAVAPSDDDDFNKCNFRKHKSIRSLMMV